MGEIKTMHVEKIDNISTKQLVDIVFNFCDSLTIPEKKLRNYQITFAKRIIRSLLDDDGAEITGLFARQTGKSETIANVCSGCMIILPILARMAMFTGDKRLEKFRVGVWFGCFAPKKDQATIIFTRIKDNLNTRLAKSIMESSDINCILAQSNANTFIIKFVGLDLVESKATAITASEKATIEGGSFHCVILDEAQEIDDIKYEKSIKPMVSAYHGTKVLIGTPSFVPNFFYYAILRNEEAYKKSKKIRDHYQYDGDYCAKFSVLYAKSLATERKQLGEQSDTFRISYLLHWIFERGMYLTEQDLLLNYNREKSIGQYDRKKGRLVAGIDLGKAQDSTVVTILEVDWDNPVIKEAPAEKNPNNDIVNDVIVYPNRIVNWLEIKGDNWNLQYEAILNFLGLYPIQKVVIDATGVGSPTYDRILAAVEYDCEPFIFTMPAKSALFKYHQTLVKSGFAGIPIGDLEELNEEESKHFYEFKKQVLGATKMYSGSNLVVKHNDDKKSHDDYLVSWALACYATRGEVEQVEIVKNTYYKATRGKRKRIKGGR